jgi:hypothetical protein
MPGATLAHPKPYGRSMPCEPISVLAAV